jgi:cell migration-inducing and hyaluronan-binding protein
VETVFEDFTSYKNRNGGMWARGELNVFKGLKLADNAIGYTHASGNLGEAPYTSRVVDSLFVGETENIGNPSTPAEKAYGRSLPFPEIPDYPIHGYEFYDFRHHLDNVTFVNFEDNDTRKTGAITYLLFTSFGMSSNNTVQGAKFTNAKPVYFPPVEHRWSNDDYGNGSYMTAVFQDKDGSIGGVPNSYILINEGIAIDEACEIKPTWNAAVCTGDIGRMNVGGDSSVIGFAEGGRRFVAGEPVAPPQPPVILSRNDKEFRSHGATNVRAGTEIKVTTERPSIPLSVTELDAGSWVMFELPGFTTADSGTAVDSLDALHSASTTSYYKGNDSLWVKLVSIGDIPGAAGRRPGGGARLQVSR